MKKLLELLVCFLHPLAVILMWVDLAGTTVPVCYMRTSFLPTGIR